jgi:hypothetical protein
MQRCEKCGQINNNYEERCIYCGEFLYIAVDHDDNQYHQQPSRKRTVRDDCTDEIIEELSNTNNEATEFLDIEDNPFTRTIEDNSHHEDTSYVNDDYIDDSFINAGDRDFRDFEVNEGHDIFEEDNIQEDIYPDDTFEEDDRQVKPPKKQHILDLEDDLKRKIKRNKKLENSMGIMFSDIEVDVTSIKNPIEISGVAHFNQNMIRDDVKLSVICLDVLQKRLDRQEVILENRDNREHVNFSVTIHPNIHKTARIILLPETVNPQTPVEEEDDIPDVELNPHITNQIFIEQMHDIERKIGMRITNTSILLKSDRKIEVVGEIHLKNPDKYSNILITGTCYDKNNQIIATESTKINTRLFLGFDTLRLIVNDVDVRKIQRVRIYPTLQGLDY